MAHGSRDSVFAYQDKPNRVHKDHTPRQPTNTMHTNQHKTAARRHALAQVSPTQEVAAPVRETPVRDSLLRLPQVCKITCLSKSTIYLLAAKGDFPVGIRVSPRCVAWSAKAVHDWVDEQVRKAEGKNRPAAIAKGSA